VYIRFQYCDAVGYMTGRHLVCRNAASVIAEGSVTETSGDPT